ncbi:sialoadhesin-like [Trematomus bernacchii]|uniref:sialoadhesin-like n=1 Tax=Trematomus bernacchii TaxID=40690 RepID=UPI00146D035F|nr:sialoadhesin-like [Trematomus bernacchii]
MGRLKGEMSSTQWSDVFTLTVSYNKPEPVLTVSPSWPSPGASVTLNCRVDYPSAGWSFYWYKAVPQKSDDSYSYELLPGSENGTEQHLFIIDGQTHTAGYVCRAGRGDPVFYSWHSSAAFLWSGDLNSAASLTVSPDSVQHFTKTPLSLSCEGNSTEWRVRRFSEADNLYHCSSWGTMTGSICTITRRWLSGVFWCESETGHFSNAVNITKDDDGQMILVSPVRPVAEGLPVTLSCKLNNETVLYDVDFYKNDKLIQNDNRRELTISAVSKSDEGFYKCKRRDLADSRTSSESWLSVKSSRPGKVSQFPVLLTVGLLCGVLLIILPLLFMYRYRKSKDAVFIRSQSTNQGPATDHMINQDEIQNMPQYSTLLHGDRCLYETIRGPVEAGNGASNEPEESLYINVAADQ